jgi:16S rRNA (guanine527-N7)-methyltransferase
MSDPATLTEVLRRAQRLGTLGDRPVEEVIEHARLFLAALTDVTGKVLDMGTGAGVPGLIIAHDRSDLSLVLVDRRATRMDELARAVQALGCEDRVTAITADLKDLGRQPEHGGQYDAVVSRGFGAPDVTLRSARPMLRMGGRLVVTEPRQPHPERWPKELLQTLGFSQPQYLQGIVLFHVEQLPS